MRRSITMILALLLFAGPALAGWEEGVAAFKKKDYKTAEQHFQQMVDERPEVFQGQYMLGLTKQALKKHEEAQQHLRKAYDLNPGELSVQLALGKAYTSMRRYAEAAKLLGGIDTSGLPSSQKVAFYQMRGKAYVETGNDQKALSDLKQLAQLQPSDAQTQYLYGVTAAKVGQEAIAIKALGDASRLAPKDADMKRAYVTALVKQGRGTRDKAQKKETYRKASILAGELVAMKSNYDNLILQCSAELGGSLYNEATTTCKKATEASGSDWLAFYYLGQAYTSANQFDKAAAPLKEAETKTSKSGDLKNVWTQLGFVCEKQKNYPCAVDYYQKAGNSGAVARVQNNQQTAKENALIEAENAKIQEMEAEAKRLEEELKAMEGGGGR